MAKKKGDKGKIYLALAAIGGVGLYSFLKLNNLSKNLQITPYSFRITNASLTEIKGDLYFNVVNASSVALKINSLAGTVTYLGDTIINYNLLTTTAIEPKSKFILKIPFQVSTTQLLMTSYTLVQDLIASKTGMKANIEGVVNSNFGSVTFKNELPISFGSLGKVIKPTAKKTTKK